MQFEGRTQGNMSNYVHLIGAEAIGQMPHNQ